MSSEADERATVAERGGGGPSSAALDHSGEIVGGRHRLVRKVGAGSMGDVYEGRELIENRRVAIKILKPERAMRDMFRQRFLREAKSAQMIGHPNVVRVYELGETEQGLPYYVMEYLEGEDLRVLLDRERRLPWHEARAILDQVAGAIAAAHEQGIVHRDIKPSNVLIWDEPSDGATRRVVKLLDFGVAKLRVDLISKELTQAADVVGTVLYMAPEQAEGRSADARSDIYAFGVMAYELVTGTVPFSGNDIFEVMRQHLTVEPMPPSQLAPDLPPEAEAFILRCLAKRPEARFQSMRQASHALAEPGPSRARRQPAQTLRVTPLGPGVRLSSAEEATHAAIDPQGATIATSPQDLGHAHLDTVRAALPDGGFDDAPTAYFRAPVKPLDPMARSTMPYAVPESGRSPTHPRSSGWSTDVSKVRRHGPVAVVLGVAFVAVVVATIAIGLALVVIG